MRTLLRTCTTALLPILLLGIATELHAQTPAADFYMKYRKALAEAKKVDDIFPFVSDKTKKQMQDTPADQREMMFGMMQMMNDQQDIKVVKESRTGSGVTLTLEGMSAEKNKVTGTVTLVTENGALRIDRESWTEH